MQNKITQFNQSNVKQLINELDAAITKVANELGLVLQPRKNTYSNLEYNFSRTLSVAGAKIFPESPVIGSKFKVGNDIFTVIAFISSRPKFPISVENSAGKKFKMTLGMYNSSTKL